MSPSSPRALGCVVLAGGRGARLGHDKAAFVFDGSPLLSRVLANVVSVCAPVVVAAREGQTIEGLPSTIAIVRDKVVDGGPLAGIVAGLEALSPHAEAAFIVATDMPFTSAAFILALASTLHDREATCVLVGGVAQPIGAIFRTDTVRRAEALLSTSHASPRRLLEALDTNRVEADVLWQDPTLAAIDPNRRALEDIDTEADVLRLSRR